MERKVREICKKNRILAMVLAVVFMVLAQSAVVKAEETVEVTVDGILYELDEENKIASLKTYINKSDANCKEIIIPNQVVYDGEKYTVTSIGNSAFKDAQYLEWITIPNTVESIGNEALCNCKNIKKLVIPDSVMSMGDSSIQGCTSLEEVVLPAKLEDLSLAMLNGCVNLKKITLPENLKGIAIAAFNGCVSLEQLTLPNSLQAIGWDAFSNCTGLTQLVIPEGVEYASGDCIDGCSNMEAVFYPANLKESFEESALETVVQVSYVVNPDGTVSLKVEKLPEGVADFKLPADIGGRKIVSITGPQGVNLPVSCTKHFTKTYTKSADGHQYTCAVCKKTVKEAHSYPSGSKSCVCGYVPFAIAVQPTGLQLAYVHKDAVLSVEAKATFGTEKITYQWLENGTAIAGATFSTYKIPQGQPVGSHTYTCKLTSGGYSQVTKAVIVTVKPPVKGKKYKDDANMATYKVTKARVDGQGTVEYVKPVSKKKATVIIPATVEIGGVTYKVTAIAKNAFKNNKKIKRLTIEEHVGKIGAGAFSGCKKLKNITIKTIKLKAKKVGAGAFKNIKSNATIKVPKKKLKAYKSMLKKKGVSKKAKIRKI